MKMLIAVFAAVIASGAACNEELSTAASPSDTPAISVLSPSSGPVGTRVTLTGSGFAAEHNTVKFGTGFIKEVASPDGRTIRVSVPATLDQCPPRIGDACLAPSRMVTPGAYAVAVVNNGATSNELTFTVLQE